MKKLVLLLIALIIMIPSSVFGEFAMDNQPDEYIGCWATFVPYSSNGYGDQSIVVILNRDGTMSFFLSINKAEEKLVTTTAETGKWTVVNDTVIFQRDGKDTYGKWEYHDDMVWFELYGGKFGLKKIPVIDITQVIYPQMDSVGNE